MTTIANQYAHVESPADMLTMYAAEGRSLGDILTLTSVVLVPYWANDIYQADQGADVFTRRCDPQAQDMLSRVLRKMKFNSTQGFGVLRATIGQDHFERYVTKPLGNRLALPLFQKEMEGFEHCNSIADLQARLLAFVPAGRFLDDLNRPRITKSVGERKDPYSDADVYQMLGVVELLAEYSSGKMSLPYNVREQYRRLFGQLPRWGGLREKAVDVLKPARFPEHKEDFEYSIGFGVARKMMEWTRGLDEKPKHDDGVQKEVRGSRTYSTLR